MYQNTKKSTFRTAQELAFFLERGTIQLTQAIWEWIALQGELSKEIEIDLKDFERFVSKHRHAPFSHWWVKNRFQWLVDNRIVGVVKSFSATAYRLILRPFSHLVPPKKKSQNHLLNLNSTCDLDTSNPQSANGGVNNINISNPKISNEEREELKRVLEIVKLCERHGYQPHASIFNLSIDEIKSSLESWSSQLYEQLERNYDILKLCAEYKIYYDPFKAGTQALFQHELAEVELALKHFLKSGGHDLNPFGKPIISNPQGWLIRCLEQGWYTANTFTLDSFIAVMETFLPKDIPRDYS
ncbi:MAG: hypothetical protein ACFKPT_24675 [Gloeotrichia echinulata GP01]